jgi:MFS family permease
MNKILKLLVFSDIFIFTGFGFIAPILSIFINDNLQGGTILAAGIASGIFLITSSVLQIIFSYIFNPKDRYWMLIFGTIFIVLVPFGYIFSKNIWHIFIVQFIYGLGAGFAYPSWYSLFSSHLEKGKRGFQHSVYYSSVGIGSAITAGVGAWIAEKIGFEFVFVFAGILSIIGLLILFRLNKKELLKKY